jgi:hypothetical protein
VADFTPEAQPLSRGWSQPASWLLALQPRYHGDSGESSTIENYVNHVDQPGPDAHDRDRASDREAVIRRTVGGFSTAAAAPEPCRRTPQAYAGHVLPTGSLTPVGTGRGRAKGLTCLTRMERSDPIPLIDILLVSSRRSRGLRTHVQY